MLPFKVETTTEIEKWRLDTFWTKEPETVAWIDTFKPRDRLLDIGANIGLYSLYAATKGCGVLAVEPHPINYLALCNNIGLNEFDPGIVKALWYVVGEGEGMREFHYTSQDAGSSDGSMLPKGTETRVVRVPLITVDALIRRHEFGPHHIKIDVDGSEDAVVMGMERSLALRCFQSCLIEVEPRCKPVIVEKFEKAGYNLDSPLNEHPRHSRQRRQREGIAVENLIFCRTP